MALSNEDKKDVAGAFGKKAASAVSKATRDKSYVPTNSNADLIRTARKTRDKGTLGSYGTKWLASASRENSSKSKALKSKTDDKKVEHFKAIKEHVSGDKKSGGFNDPFWYSKK